MNCPFCGKKMISGFVQSGREVFFTEKRHKYWFRADEEEILLTQHNLTGPTGVAYHCPDCKKVIIDYEVEQQ